MTDLEGLDLTPQQRSALRRADENPEQLTEYDGRILGELLMNGDDDTRKETAGSLKHASAQSGAARTLTAEIGPLTDALDDEIPLVLTWAAGALGNIGAEAPRQVGEAVDPLVTLLHYRSEYLGVRSAAATALGKIGREAPEQVGEAIGPLVDLLQGDESSVRGGAATALGHIGRGDPEQVGEAIDPLAAALDDEDGFVRSRATDALENIGRGAPGQVGGTADPLAALDDDGAARRIACHALMQLDGDTVLDDEKTDVRRRAAWALSYAGSAGADEEIVPATGRLCDLLSDDDGDVRRAASLSFGRLHAADRSYPDGVEEELEARFEEGATPLDERLDDERIDVAVAAAFALFRAGSADHDLRATARDRLREGLATAEHRPFTAGLVAELAETGPAIHPMMREMFADDDAEDDPAVRDLVPDLVDLLDDEKGPVRRHACRALGHLDAEAAVDDLQRLASEDDDGAVREAAGEALDRIDTRTEPSEEGVDATAEPDDRDGATGSGVDGDPAAAAEPVATTETLRDDATGEPGTETPAGMPGSLADRAALYARLLEYARTESLHECHRWARELRTFVEANPVDDEGYEAAREQAIRLADERLPATADAYGPDHDLVTGDGSLAEAAPELHEAIGDVTFAVRRCYVRGE